MHPGESMSPRASRLDVRARRACARPVLSPRSSRRARAQTCSSAAGRRFTGACMPPQGAQRGVSDFSEGAAPAWVSETRAELQRRSGPAAAASSSAGPARWGEAAAYRHDPAPPAPRSGSSSAALGPASITRPPLEEQGAFEDERGRWRHVLFDVATSPAKLMAARNSVYVRGRLVQVPFSFSYPRGCQPEGTQRPRASRLGSRAAGGGPRGTRSSPCRRSRTTSRRTTRASRAGCALCRFRSPSRGRRKRIRSARPRRPCSTGGRSSSPTGMGCLGRAAGGSVPGWRRRLRRRRARKRAGAGQAGRRQGGALGRLGGRSHAWGVRVGRIASCPA